MGKAESAKNLRHKNSCKKCDDVMGRTVLLFSHSPRWLDIPQNLLPGTLLYSNYHQYLDRGL
jgi:hypothetical protein